MAVEVVDIRLLDASAFTPLLEAESLAWTSELRWDYAPSARLIASCLAEKRLPGYALLSDHTILGYCFFLYEGEKGLIGDLFVPSREDGRARATLLLEHVIATLKASPGIDRIEAQLPHFSPGDLEDCFSRHNFQAFRRRFMALGLNPNRTSGASFSTARAGKKGAAIRNSFVLDAWHRKYDDAAARLLYSVYRGHVDAAINDQYRSVAGASRLIDNIVHLRGCGEILPEVSRVAIHSPSGKLAGILALTSVRPGTAHIPQVAVATEFQSHGVGLALMESAFSELERLGYQEVSLTVTDDNRGAVRLYERQGFETFRTFGAFAWNR